MSRRSSEPPPARADRARSPLHQALLRGRTAELSLRIADLGQQITLRNYRLFLRSAEAGLGLVDDLSPHAAWRAAEHARRRVPAYRMLLERTGWRDDPRLAPAERLRRLPVTDKATYVRAFSTEDRCLDGRIPPGRHPDRRVLGRIGHPVQLGAQRGRAAGRAPADAPVHPVLLRHWGH